MVKCAAAGRVIAYDARRELGPVMQKQIGGGRIRQAMVTGTSPSFERIDSVLQALGATGGAPEAHGSLCGLVCFFGNKAGELWVAGLLGPAIAACLP